MMLPAMLMIYIRVKQDWTETGATWNTYDGTNNWTTAGAGNVTDDRGSTALGVLSGGIGTRTIVLNTTGVSLVQDWIDGDVSNYGITIQDYSESEGMGFDSRDNGTASNTPRLCITFSDGPSTLVTLVSSNLTVANNFATNATGELDIGDLNLNVTGNMTNAGSLGRRHQ